MFHRVCQGELQSETTNHWQEGWQLAIEHVMDWCFPSIPLVTCTSDFTHATLSFLQDKMRELNAMITKLLFLL